MEGHPTPHSQRSCWRRALNPWQALGKGSGVSPSVCHPRSLLPGVAAQPRTGTPAYLLGLVLPGLVPLPLAPHTYRSQSSMLGAMVLLLALLPGISTLPSGPPGM